MLVIVHTQEILIDPASSDVKEARCLVTYPAPNWKGTLEELANRVVPKGVTYKIMDSSRLPSAEFRNAWEETPTGVKENFEKAKEIAKERGYDLSKINSARSIEDLRK